MSDRRDRVVRGEIGGEEWTLPARKITRSADDVVEAWQVCHCCDNATGEHQHDDTTCEHPCCPGWDAELNDGLVP